MKILTRILAMLVLWLLTPLKWARLTDGRSPFIGQGEDTGAWRRLIGPLLWVGISTTWEGRELNWRIGPLQWRIGTWHSAIWWKHQSLLARWGLRRRPEMFPGETFVGWTWRLPFTSKYHERGKTLTFPEYPGYHLEFS